MRMAMRSVARRLYVVAALAGSMAAAPGCSPQTAARNPDGPAQRPRNNDALKQISGEISDAQVRWLANYHWLENGRAPASIADLDSARKAVPADLRRVTPSFASMTYLLDEIVEFQVDRKGPAEATIRYRLRSGGDWRTVGFQPTPTPPTTAPGAAG